MSTLLLIVIHVLLEKSASYVSPRALLPLMNSCGLKIGEFLKFEARCCACRYTRYTPPSYDPPLQPAADPVSLRPGPLAAALLILLRAGDILNWWKRTILVYDAHSPFLGLLYCSEPTQPVAIS